MITTLDLPDDLIEEAMSITDVKNQTQLIILALQELIKNNKIIQLKSFKGKVDLNIDLDTLRNRNEHSG
ncbi:MAG: type II toxin-antitoxin system VapB family antitoxin [Methylococcales bacterium]|nr:type II toxin-antitoxin system VapB family antitoxin [Methylococcales bacterium]